MGVKVQKLSSTKTQLPYEYYSLPFCKPAEVVNSVENLGEVGPLCPCLSPCSVSPTAGSRQPKLTPRVPGAAW